MRSGIAGKAIEQAAPHAEGKTGLCRCGSQGLGAGAHHRFLSCVDAIRIDRASLQIIY
ncbi:hypothetical protein CBM2592_A220122 [Cupriavidus taiwanensis]|nr:hypothetical protein CBM2592_A220122 [Cupriavidus taiwanensis]SOY83628.1 hypothetical protein CBM2591_A260121 [Cupriavidus taiwanensis]SOZ23506.1 hypothetical protein CBM2608_A260062 [Cupriavidus taiwanensis]SOZ57635.1 hypothetical protein CBM2617_A240121 [Cupriavidus taiwanensis]SOZ79589.1 hypothetical protein CBM2618_A220120 [Cupriavidus taiwanensis]